MNINILEESIPRIASFLQANLNIIKEVPRPNFISLDTLERQILLYIPRLFTDSHKPTPNEFKGEIKRIINILQDKIEPFKDFLGPPSNPPRSIKEMVFSIIDAPIAKIIHERFHYLGSFRNDGIHLGFRSQDEDKVISLITLSPFDLDHIYPYVPTGVSISEIMVVSRIYSFDWSPRNTISYMLKRTNQFLYENHRNIKMLITYLNPNIGFTGSSYKASGWNLFGKEGGTRYSYLDGNYITDRELVKIFGTSASDVLINKEPNRFEVTKINLAPLSIFSFFRYKKLLYNNPNLPNNIFMRPL